MARAVLPSSSEEWLTPTANPPWTPGRSLLEDFPFQDSVDVAANSPSEMLPMEPEHAARTQQAKLRKTGRFVVLASDHVLVTRLKRLQTAGADIESDR